jgi:hypothetical protein
MRTLAIALFALCAAPLAGGCDGERTTTTSATTTDAHTAGALVIYQRFGGIAFTAQQMVVEQDGSAKVEVKGPGRIRADFLLTDAELAELRELLADATLETPPPSGCNDCYGYSIEYMGPPAIFDETSFPPGAEPLIEFLSALVERETPTGPLRNG